MKKACLINNTVHASIHCFDLKLPERNLSDDRILESGSPKMMHTGRKNAKKQDTIVKTITLYGVNVGRIYSTWNLDMRSILCKL
jgi:hypothetical protein